MIWQEPPATRGRDHAASSSTGPPGAASSSTGPLVYGGDGKGIDVVGKHFGYLARAVTVGIRLDHRDQAIVTGDLLQVATIVS